MNKYISILRGINVSGQKKIKMLDLKALYRSLNLEGVETYIQSGNVIFSSDLNDKLKIRQQIEGAIKEQYGFDVPVFVFDASEFIDFYNELPFQNVNLIEQGTQILLTLLQDKTTEPLRTQIGELVSHPDAMIIKDHVVYLHCPNGYGKSKFSNNFLEKKLKTHATTRNLKTIAKLCEMLAAND